MKITSGQYNRLAELFLDIAKAMFIAAFAARAISELSPIATFQSLIAAGVFMYLSLYAEKRKEEKI